MLRTSSYTIYSDLPEEPGSVLLVHGYTGAYDRISREVAAYLKSREITPRSKPLYGEWSSDLELRSDVPPPSDAVISILEKRGYLTELTFEEEIERFGRFVQKIHEASAARPTYLFMPTYDCNLRCSYCFQDEMRTDPGKRHLLRMMSRDMVDRLFSAVRHLEAQLPAPPPDRPRVRRVGFFGGEPLTRRTLPIVEHIHRVFTTEGEATFWAVTNGTELEQYGHLLGPGRIGELQITLDGPPGEHDRRRIYPDGSGSWDRIARNISLALSLGAQVSIRINLDRNNVEMLPALTEELVAQGWTDRPGFTVYTAPIWASNDQTDPETTFGSWELDRAIDRLREEHESLKGIGAPDDHLKSQIRRVFDESHDPMPDFKASFCGAHSGMYIFDAFGDVYACWEHTGDPKVRIGHVEEDGAVTLNVDLERMWRSRTVVSNPVCQKCRYALYCGGGCAVRALQTSGEFFHNYCDTFQRRFRVTAAEAYSDFKNGRTAPAQSRVCDL